MARKKLALIDSNALIHRAYHALPPMTTREGQPTNAVYGFTTMLLKMFSTLKPTHVVAAFDVKGPTFRDEEFEDYKAHRKPADEELVSQFDLVRDVVAAFDIPIFELSGYEADDIIGTIVSQVDGDVSKVIVTGDKDTLQLIDDDTSVFTLKRGITDTILYDEDVVEQEFGFGPAHVIDYKGLRGDPSDNIPGVAGVGDKTAKELIELHGSVEEIFEHLDDLPEKFLKKLKGKKKEAMLSKKLATIKRDVPIEFSLDDAEMDGYDSDKVAEVFRELEFKSLVQRLPEGGSGIQPTLFSGDEDGEGDVEMPENYHLVESKKDIADLKKRLTKASLVAFDTENDSLGARTYPIVGMSFAFYEGKKIQAFYVPVARTSVKDWADVLENSDIPKTGHNLKYDIEVLRQSDIDLKGVVFDSMIASYLLHPGARQHSLDTLAIQELDYHTIPISDLLGSKKDGRMSEVSLPKLARYAAEDADISLQLHDVLSKKIEEEKLSSVMDEIELPLIHVLAEMELNGVAVDVGKLDELQKKLSKKLSSLEKRIWKAAGEEFNINSTQQLREVLYEKLKLPTADIKKTQSGFSTAASELEKLRSEHEIISMLEDYREFSKLLNTYIRPLPGLVDEKTGRIYAQFNQTVAATGRLSSTDPNLQNIPTRTKTGQLIRAAFVADKGNVLVKADYSQIELRLAAHMSGDAKMIDAFRAGEDIHTATAAWVQGIEIDEVTPEQRRAAKELNFGVLYGMGAQSFSRAADISLEEARSFIGRYRQQYSGLASYLEAVAEEARATEEVSTLFGRKRYVPEINSRTPMIRASAERIACNFPLQGTAADILKKAMIELQAEIEKSYPEAKLVLTVHDELVVEVLENKAQAFAARMKEVMESVISLDVPLIVDVGVGENWRDVVEVG